MTPSSEFPVGPENDRVVDPEILAARRARRAEESEPSPAERRVAELEHRLAEAEEGRAAAQRERLLLAGAVERAEGDLTAALQREFAEHRRRIELDRRTAVHGDGGARVAELHQALEIVQLRATARGADAFDAVTAAVAETRQLRGAIRTLQQEQRDSAADAEQAAAAAVSAHVDELAAQLALERERRARAEALLETERARSAAEHASTAALLSAAVERGNGTADARLSGLQRSLDALRAQSIAAVERLEGRVAFEREARDVVERELAAEREARTAEANARSLDIDQLSARLSVAEVALAEARALHAGEGSRPALAIPPDGLWAAGREPGGRLEETPAGRWVTDAELAREATARAEAERRAGDALDALTTELERLRAAGAGNPIYDALGAGRRVPSADHPALSRPEAPEPDGRTAPPAVVGDLARAAARLRAAGEVGAARTGAEDEDEPGDVADPEAPGPGSGPGGVAADADGARRDADAGDADAARHLRAPAIPAARAGVAGAASPTLQPWLAPALARLAGVDAATAERLLLAAFSVQARRVDREVAYAVVLPATGRHDVHVAPSGDVRVAPPGARGPREAEFCLEGSVEALAPLAAGGAARRLAGVTVRGRRRRLRRLLRRLRDPVGLAELQGAGARPRPGDLLALLCLGVPAASVSGADFSVAYVVRGPDGSRSRTLVRAEPDGSLTAIPEAPDLLPADATVTVDASSLLGVLAGAEPVAPEGDGQAVATLQGWLRAAQGLPA